MAKKRSPNYPTLSLGGALEVIRPVFQQENRNKMSRLVLAQHMGYTSLNGRALSKIGAVRAYGLIEGTGDELRVSDEAITALTAPEDSNVREGAIGHLALKPDLFKELRKDFPDTNPSLENLRFNLIQRRFTESAAEKAAQNYLTTMALVSGNLAAYNAESGDGGDAKSPQKPGHSAVSRAPRQNRRQELNIMEGERELTTGLLSKAANFRLIVSGPVGVKEIERLITKLELDKVILQDVSEPMATEYTDDEEGRKAEERDQKD